MSDPIPNGLEAIVPETLRALPEDQTVIPRLAKDVHAVAQISDALRCLPTTHRMCLADARQMEFLAPQSVHLVLTSPPYWTLKQYNDTDGQLGHVADYESFLTELEQVWRKCYDALVPGGRLICVVGDVCLSRKANNGRHMVMPLHAAIQEQCRTIGYDNLAPIIWHKIANAKYEVEGGGGFLGKPYEPNGVIKNDIEFILMQRKPGGYRKPAWPTRLMSVIPEDKHREWFQQVWGGVTGASTRNHPAPFPEALAERLIRMFSFAGDVVLDPFLGSGTTAVAASQWGRNSIGVEIDPSYFAAAKRRLSRETQALFSNASIEVMRLEGTTP